MPRPYCISTWLWERLRVEEGELFDFSVHAVEIACFRGNGSTRSVQIPG